MLKQFGNIVTHLERMLRRRPDRHTLIVPMGDHRVRLHGVVIDHGERKMIFDDQIGLSEAFLYVASFDAFVAADVATVIFMYQRRAVGARGVDPDYRGQFFVLHVDKRNRLFGRRQIRSPPPPPPARRHNELCSRQSPADRCRWEQTSPRSAAVSTAATPGKASAFEVSMERIRAWG